MPCDLNLSKAGLAWKKGKTFHEAINARKIFLVTDYCISKVESEIIVNTDPTNIVFKNEEDPMWKMESSFEEWFYKTKPEELHLRKVPKSCYDFISEQKDNYIVFTKVLRKNFIEREKEYNDKIKEQKPLTDDDVRKHKLGFVPYIYRFWWKVNERRLFYCGLQHFDDVICSLVYENKKCTVEKDSIIPMKGNRIYLKDFINLGDCEIAKITDDLKQATFSNKYETEVVLIP